MKKEKILVFGDSYSTFEGYIPEGYSYYYPREGDWGVDDVTNTWWKMLEKETESEIILNNSWSGSTICNRGYKGDCSETSSFMHRLDVLIAENFFVENKPDRVLVFGGTNDSWIAESTGNIKVGELKFDGWTKEDLNTILPAICHFIDKLQNTVPREKIHYIINTDLLNEVRDGIVEICKHYNISCTLLKDIEKIDGHPTFKGMTEIKNQILKNI